MNEKASKVTSADIRAALTLRYPAKSHALMFEVAPETGGGTRYADAVAVGLWKSHGHRIEGIEVKVSRSDFLAEMKQPEKSQPVYRYCNHWWLATPKGLVSPDELPPTWGLLELLDGGQLREKVKAPVLTPEPVTIGFFAALARRGAANVGKEVDALLARERQAIEKSVRDRCQYEFDRRLAERQSKIERGVALIEKIKAETGIDFAGEGWNSPEWLAACRVLATMGLKESYGRLSQLRDAAQRMAEFIDKSGLLQADEVAHG